MTHSLQRAAADECLRTVFGDHYGQVTMDQSSLLIDDLIDLDTDERNHDLYFSAGVLRARIGGPERLAGYAATLEAGAR